MPDLFSLSGKHCQIVSPDCVRYTLLSSTLHLFLRRGGADISSLCLEHSSTPFIYHYRRDGKPAARFAADEGNSEASNTITDLLVRSREEELQYRSFIYLATGERVRGGGLRARTHTTTTKWRTWRNCSRG